MSVPETPDTIEALRESRERFALAMRGSRDGHWDWDLAGGIVYFSPRWKEMLGWRDDELENAFSTWENLIHPDDLAGTRRTLDSYLSGERTEYGPEFRMRCKDGSWRWILARGVALRDAQGRPVRMAGSHSDITERKHTEEALRSAEIKFRGLVEQLPAITYHATLGETCIWSYVSPQILPLLGFTPAEWLASDRLWFEHIHPDDREIPIAAEAVALKTGSFLAEYRMSTRDGALRWFRDQAVFVADKNQNEHVLYGVMMDITEAKAAETRLAELNLQLRETSRQAGMAEVATAVLHNVGNVLNSVNVATNLVVEKLRASKAPKLGKAAALIAGHSDDLGSYLRHDPSGQKLPGYLANLGAHLITENADLLREMEQLGRNIEHIKQVVATQQSWAKVSGVYETLPAERLVEDAIAMNAGCFEQHGILLKRNFSETPPVLVDRHKVLQILINLIRNARNALDDTDRLDKRIAISIAPAGGDGVRIDVTDNGMGIPPENLDRIFGHGFTTRKDGHGFGLHSGANAAKEMGGTLTVSSPGPGGGATFILTLPVEDGATGPARAKPLAGCSNPNASTP